MREILDAMQIFLSLVVVVVRREIASFFLPILGEEGGLVPIALSQGKEMSEDSTVEMRLSFMR